MLTNDSAGEIEREAAIQHAIELADAERPSDGIGAHTDEWYRTLPVEGTASRNGAVGRVEMAGGTYGENIKSALLLAEPTLVRLLKLLTDS